MKQPALFRIVFILSMTLAFSACSRTTGNIKPEFNTAYFTGLETDVVTRYDEAKLDYDLTSPTGDNIHFSHCPEVDKLDENAVAQSEYHLFIMLKLNCLALKRYLQATAAKSSYLDELLVNKDISQLPATIYPYVNEYDKSKRLGKTLAQYYPELKFKLLDDGAIDATTSTDTLLYQVLATGDFNNDGVLDALIRVDWHVLNAFGKGSILFMVTRTSENSPIVELPIH